MIRQRIGLLIGALIIALVWELAGSLSKNFPGIESILIAGWHAIEDQKTWGHLTITAQRLLIGFTAGWVFGTLIGALMGFYQNIQQTLRILVVISLAIPSPVTAIAVTLLVGMDESVLTAALALSILPFAAVSMESAIKGRDLKLNEMAKLYRFSWQQRVVNIHIPQMLPYMVSSIRTNFALAWKLLVAIEAVVSSKGIGAAMLFAFHLLNSELMVAYTLLFMIFIGAIELLLLHPLERLSDRWRV